MEHRTKKQIEVALLAIIALVLIYRSYTKFFAQEDVQTIAGEQATANPPVQNPSNPFQPATVSKTLSNNGNPVPRALMAFDNTVADLGEVRVGEKKRYRFGFTNTGQVQLLIQEVSADEGLFIVSRPRDPVPPGGTAEILCELLDNVPAGDFEKTIHINSNANPNHIHLTVKAEIVDR